MKITSFTSDQFGEFLTLVDQAVRPVGSPSHAWEDSPVVLGSGNRKMVRGICADGRVAAGVACLVRQFQTSCGTIPVAGIGRVVTRPEYRGRGFSRVLQRDLIDSLRQADVPLAVLWNDQPNVYHGQGFVSAGWEFHLNLEGLAPDMDFPAGFSCRDFRPADSCAAEGIYNRHPYRTVRLPGDGEKLYSMPGTRGLVAVGEDDLVAAMVFCGKGANFPEYVLEWGGPLGLVSPLVGEAVRRGWAKHLLAPPGGEPLAGHLSLAGATVLARDSGHWLVVQPEQLARYLQGSGHGAGRDPSDPAALLGTVGPDGVVVPGILTIAIWGFDSV